MVQTRDGSYRVVGAYGQRDCSVEQVAVQPGDVPDAGASPSCLLNHLGGAVESVDVLGSSSSQGAGQPPGATPDVRGRPDRPWLTVVLDDYSRAVAGYTVFLGAPTAEQTALALHQAVRRKPNPGRPVMGLPDVL